MDLPDPVGLIESTDGGRTWTALSRTGESDFDALAGWDSGALGVGHGLERTDDLTTWSSMDAAPEAFDVSTYDGVEVLVTNEDGPQRSLDGGLTWSALPATPVLQFVEHRSLDAVVGVTPEGVAYASEDGGLSWVEVGDLQTPPVALAIGVRSPVSTILVLTETGLFELDEDGDGFAPWG